MKKQTQIFMLPADEASFSRALLEIRPALQLIDDNVWDRPQPTLVESIEQCRTSFCFLWDKGICDLPIGKRSDGRFEGPIAGVVVQVVRSRLVGNQLYSGRIAAGINDSSVAMGKFVKDVWKALRSVVGARPSVIDVDTGEVIRSGVTEYQLGRHAERWAQDPLNKLRDRSSQIFFAPGRAA